MMNLPRRFAVWEVNEFHTGVVQVCSTETLQYNYDEVLRIYPEREVPRMYSHIVRGRMRIHQLNNGRPMYGRRRVQLAHTNTQLIHFVVTDSLVVPFNLHTGEQLDDELPLVLIFGEYLYGAGRPLHNYSFELIDTYRYRPMIEEIYSTFLDAFNLPPMRHQPVLWEDELPRLDQHGVRHRRNRRHEFDEIPELIPPTPEMPAERIALAIARDFQHQGEVCPITQEPLKAGQICVTGCLCVFQADALLGWARGHTSCPSCRKQLIYRTVTVGSEENIMTGH